VPDTVLITMFSQVPLRSAAGLNGLLDAFESIPECVPTHWGPDERARDPYDRQAMVQTVSSFALEHKFPGLHRRKPPRYEAYFSARDAGMKYVKVEFGAALSDAMMRTPFALADGLAKALEPVYGIVHPIWRLGAISQSYSASGIFKAADFQKCGPRAICARTWFGPKLIDRDVLVAAGCIVKGTAWGGEQVDLVVRPEAATFEDLSARQAEIMKRLQATGIFGDYSQPLQCKPGPKWTPVPIAGSGVKASSAIRGKPTGGGRLP
jgi:hypothetical protein